MSVCRIHLPCIEKNPFQPSFANKDIQETVGTGFCVFLHDQKWIITCSHVVKNCLDPTKIPIYVEGRPYEVSLHTYCPDRDVAFLTDIPDDVEACDIGDDQTLQPLDPVVVKGFPMGFSDMMTRDCKFNGRKESRLQVDGNINPGDSGGPVFDKNGQVVGMITSGIPKANEITWAQPISVILSVTVPSSNIVQHRPVVGLSVQPITKDWCELYKIPVEGVRVTMVEPYSCVKGKINVGDIITHVNQEPLDNQGFVSSSRVYFQFAFPDRTDISLQWYTPSSQKTGAWEGPMKSISCHHTAPFYFAGMCVIEYCCCEPVLHLYKKYNIPHDKLLVTYITSGSPAGQFGIVKKGDGLDKVNTIPVSTIHQLRKAIKDVITTKKGKVYVQWDTISQKQHVVLLDTIMKWEELTSQAQHYEPDPLFEHFSSTICTNNVCQKISLKHERD